MNLSLLTRFVVEVDGDGDPAVRCLACKRMVPTAIGVALTVIEIVDAASKHAETCPERQPKPTCSTYRRLHEDGDAQSAWCCDERHGACLPLFIFCIAPWTASAPMPRSPATVAEPDDGRADLHRWTVLAGPRVLTGSTPRHEYRVGWGHKVQTVVLDVDTRLTDVRLDLLWRGIVS